MECGNSSLHVDRSAADPRAEEIHELIRIKRPALARQESGKDKHEKAQGAAGTLCALRNSELMHEPRIEQRVQYSEQLAKDCSKPNGCTITPSSRSERHPP